MKYEERKRVESERQEADAELAAEVRRLEEKVRAAQIRDEILDPLVKALEAQVGQIENPELWMELTAAQAHVLTGDPAALAGMYRLGFTATSGPEGGDGGPGRKMVTERWDPVGESARAMEFPTFSALVLESTMVAAMATNLAQAYAAAVRVRAEKDAAALVGVLGLLEEDGDLDQAVDLIRDQVRVLTERAGLAHRDEPEGVQTEDDTPEFLVAAWGPELDRARFTVDGVMIRVAAVGRTLQINARDGGLAVVPDAFNQVHVAPVDFDFPNGPTPAPGAAPDAQTHG